jgi:hypothetical protein
MPGPGRLDQRLMVLQRAFAVVGQHQHLDAFEQSSTCAPAPGVGGERFFEIDTQQLLVTAHDPQLDDGRLVRDALEQRARRPLRLLARLSAASSSPVTPTSEAGAPSAAMFKATLAAPPGGLDLLDLDHRHRRLRGNP